MIEWFEVKCKYTKQLDNGSLKRVTEPYLFNAVSFTDAESRAYEEVGEFVKGEFMITAIKRENFSDIFNYEDSEDWYKCVVKFESFDDDSSRSKLTTNNFLLTAESVKQATERINESLKGLMSDFEVTSVSLTPIVDVLPVKAEVEA